MIRIKTPDEIKIMQTGGRMLSETLKEVCANVRPGISELELDALADKLIKEKGGEPGFKKVEGYHHATCISTNEVVVHGIPSPRVLKEGDIIGIDCGVFYQGFHTDMSETLRVRSKNQELSIKNDEVDKFLKVGRQALEAGIAKAKAGNHVGDISKAIQDIVEVQNGYSVVRSLVGHGVGKELHEDPEVPGYLQGKIEKTPELKEGMVIAIEVIYNMGGPDLAFANNDGWTLKTKDNSLAGLFERTIAITKSGPLVLTP
ncbi:MAG TPA: type I methionyl aminopeptidase [Patescibacteria group bacterium]|jgi:methionyl aminopeptidase|nr:type I methionyl aminopeptidase [Patescibacteria group bacterium]